MQKEIYLGLQAPALRIPPPTHPLTSASVLVQTRAVANPATQDAPELSHF